MNNVHACVLNGMYVFLSVYPSVCLSVHVHQVCIQQDCLLYTFLQDNNGRYPIHWVTNNSDTRCTQLLIDKVIYSHAVVGIHNVGHRW